ncbi:hypothetical protein V490_01847 [Pseudogymnoascus sp. VKM F-3557]|nr:hypothetical protein V490_01847 [Pseudogymnoascus sp. VKM F-3557]
MPLLPRFIYCFCCFTGPAQSDLYVWGVADPSEVDVAQKRGKATMFNKRFSFRKRRKDGQNDSSEGSRDTALYPANPSAFSRDRSPGRSQNGTSKSIIQQLPSSLDINSQGGQDPLGLKVIHRPLGDRRVDIVFVHGLGGSSRMTWSKNRNLDFFWPQKFLPFEQDINEARILTFGYNSNFRPGSGKNKMSILDFAKDLLYDLKYATDDSASKIEDLCMGERPIIFIVHSMGGLIVKEAYIQGQNDPIYEGIVKSISSMIFLSTPHRGTNLAETLNRILQVSFSTSPMQFIAELASGSLSLQKLNEQFRHVAPKLYIVSFYETRPTTMFKKIQMMVLEKDSSVLGYPGEISKPLDADHHGVCKYESPKDPSYIAVRNVLWSLIRKSKPRDQLQENTNHISKLNFEDYFSVSELPNDDYNFFRDRWTEGTCEWILSHGGFIEWLEDTHYNPRILWIHGNAASGKSILSSFVINHLVQLGHPCHYFFIRFADKTKRGLSMILRSLACQLAYSTPEYADKLRQLEITSTALETADFRNLWQWLYQQSLFQLGLGTPLYFVIDGVDEADSPGSVIKLLSDLNLTTIPLRVLVVSQKTHEISSAFQKLETLVHIDTILTEGNQNDFRSYIDREMDVAGGDSYKGEVTSKLLERAGGNFLWVHLAVQKINNCHTKIAVEDALQQLPSGMEALYDRMTISVQAQLNPNDRKLGESIIGWVTCAQCPLTVEELGNALGSNGLLDIYRTIGDLCGGFIVVDKEGKVAMIHETAREFLTQRSNRDQPFIIDETTTHNTILKRCLLCLTNISLRSQINRNQPPALLNYATSAWFVHFSLGSSTDTDILDSVVKFLQGPYVLIWINVAARKKDLRTLVATARYLGDVVFKLRRLNHGSLSQRQAVSSIEGWATDLVKIVGRFGNSLIQYPESIYKLIPPFCPDDSIIYQQFGRKEMRALQVSGVTKNGWDDCLARFSLDHGFVASNVLAAGGYIVILANVRHQAHIIIYNSATFEEQRRITLPERVFSIQVNKLGVRLVSYGYVTTKVWDIATGNCLKMVKNPPKRPRPQTLLFVERDESVLVGGEERCIRSLSLGDGDKWDTKAQIDEESLHDTITNLPTCSALSPDGNMVAFGYRAHPVTVWELKPQSLLGLCYIRLDATDMTTRERTWGEVFHLAWHPFSGEVFGLTLVGLLFKWDPYEEEASGTVQTGANKFTINCSGSLVATGDAIGTIQIYTTSDFSLLYQLSSQDPVLSLSFSADSRRLYDIRGAYGNVWEPNILARLADSSEYSDHNSDTLSENLSLTKLLLQTEHHFSKIDRIITLSGQSGGPLYSYGTENGVAVLCEVGHGKVCELERVVNYMSIEQIAWSEDGSLVAIGDLGGKVLVKRIAKTAGDRNTWLVNNECEFSVPSHVKQLLFHPTGSQLLALTSTRLYSMDLGSLDLVHSILPPQVCGVKWICHPKQPDYLLGFGSGVVYVFSWSGLLQLNSYSYFSSQPNQIRFEAGVQTVGRLISNVDSPYILLEILHLRWSGCYESEYLLFALAAIDVDPYSNGENCMELLSYTPLPINIASRIREPLAFLPRGRLVFLDVDRWICTWRLPMSGPRRPQGGRDSDSDGGGVEQYYFLPGDWVTTDANLCAIMPDGTLLCPQNGDVAIVHKASGLMHDLAGINATDSIQVIMKEPSTSEPSTVAEAKIGTAKAENASHADISHAEDYSTFSPAIRTYLTYLLGLIMLLSTLTATIYFPLIPLLSTHFSVPIQAINLTVTTYAIFQAISPAIFASLADAIGRRPVLLGLISLYSCASLGLALNKDIYAALVVLRALQSIGGSATPPIAYGIVADVAVVSERGKMLGPMLSTCNAISAVGPVIGGAVAMSTSGYKWAFLVLLIVAVMCFLLAGFTLPETARSVVGDGSRPANGVWRTWWSFLRVGDGQKCREERQAAAAGESRNYNEKSTWRVLSIFDSLRILLYPDAAAILWMVASSYTVYYTFQVAIPVIFDEYYAYNALQIGLSFLPGLAGMTIGGIIAGRLMDFNYARTALQHGLSIDRKKNNDLTDFPIERSRYHHTIPILLFEVALLIGYGWAVHFRAHAAVLLIIQFFACATSTLLSHTASALLVDVFPGLESTAYASGQIARCGLSAVSAAVLQPLVDRVGRGWYFTMFALFVGSSGLVAVVVSRLKGMEWRRKRQRGVEKGRVADVERLDVQVKS